MPLLKGLTGWGRDVLRTLFPATCVVCQRRLTGGETYICATCMMQLPYTRFKGARGNVVERLFWGKVPVVRANAWLHYKSHSAYKLPILSVKYFRNPRLGLYLGEQMAYDVAGTDFVEGVDAIVPVPLHRKRIKHRGYNQSERLAAGISRVTGIPVWTDVAVRQVNTTTQTALTHSERRENVSGIFALAAPERVQGCHLLLVDDVVTTGATLLSLARALCRADGVRVSIMACAMAGRHMMRADDYVNWHRDDEDTPPYHSATVIKDPI